MQNFLPALKEKYFLNSLALFGSATRSDFDPEKSDIDILVDYEKNDFSLFIDLADELEKILGRKVDLITTRSLKPHHWDYIKNNLIYV